jgi:hypothetical protein
MKDYGETVEYLHRIPVRRALVNRPEDWKWSSFPKYAGTDAAEQERRCGFAIDQASCVSTKMPEFEDGIPRTY